MEGERKSRRQAGLAPEPILLGRTGRLGAARRVIIPAAQPEALVAPQPEALVAPQPVPPPAVIQPVFVQFRILANGQIAVHYSQERLPAIIAAPLPEQAIPAIDQPLSPQPQTPVSDFASAVGTPVSAQSARSLQHVPLQPRFNPLYSNSDSDSDSEISVMSPPEFLYRGERNTKAVQRFMRGVQQQLAGLTKPNLTNVTLAVQMCTDLSMPVHAWVEEELQRLAKSAMVAADTLTTDADLLKPFTAPVYNTVIKGFMKACQIQFRDPNLLCADALGQLRMGSTDTVDMHNNQFKQTLQAWGSEDQPTNTMCKRLYLSSLPSWLTRTVHSSIDISKHTLDEIMAKMSAMYHNSESTGMVPPASDTQQWGSDTSGDFRSRTKHQHRRDDSRSPDRNRQHSRSPTRQTVATLAANIQAMTEGFGLLTKTITRQATAAPATQPHLPSPRVQASQHQHQNHQLLNLC